MNRPTSNVRGGLYQGVYLLHSIILALQVMLMAPAGVLGREPSAHPERLTLNLAGAWRVELDSGLETAAAKPPERPLSGQQRMVLPGTTDRAGLGVRVETNTMSYSVEFPYTRFPGVREATRADERGFLVREFLFLGRAWYEREVEIPAEWRGLCCRLRLERVIWRSEVWVDGRSAGSCDSLVAPHEFDLGPLEPGKHRLTVAVDNRMIHNTGTIGHAYTPETQSRWNGMIGRLELMAIPKVALERIEVYPSPSRDSVQVTAEVVNRQGQLESGTLLAEICQRGRAGVLGLTQAELDVSPGSRAVRLSVPLREPTKAWDEFSPNLYRLRLRWSGAGSQDTVETSFGFRSIEREGRFIRINGRRVFLRGTLDCCVYPNTGHPPTTVKEWLRVMRTIKEHGFNHIRFHTWCPPEAAFEAADQLGLYLQPETSFWVDDWTTSTFSKPPALGRDARVLDFVRREMRRMGEAYGNHPSFVMHVIGNEFGLTQTDWAKVEELVAEARHRDPRRLYAGSTARKLGQSDDFWVTHSVHGNGTRGLGAAGTDWDFRAACAASPVPVIAHETGQRPVFPNYARLLPKFTGPLRPYNYARHASDLREAGLLDLNAAFTRASAQFQFVLYKAEHEAMLRTPDLAGYQLLMLNDFTGQSEALVGILDPFWESKGVVARREVLAWNSPTVPLARFKRFTWVSTEVFRAGLEVAHYGPEDLDAASVDWSLERVEGRTLARGDFKRPRLPAGALTPVGEIEVPLASLGLKASALWLKVRVGRAVNQWKLWVYPPPPAVPEGSGVTLRTAWDSETGAALRRGERVLLLIHGARGPCLKQTGFESVYWSAGWWGDRFSSLGIMCDPRHPALAEFPNDGHSDWAWHELCRGATTLLMENAPRGLRPVIQPVTDFHHNELLSHLFEARVSSGRLMVCGYPLLENLETRHAARQFRASLMRYMQSEAFQPKHVLSEDQVTYWLRP